MIFETHPIGHPLDKYIESIFHYKDLVLEHHIERVVPTGNIFILFELDGFQRNTFDNDLNPIGYFKEAWISGMHQHHLNISVHKQSEMLVIQFKPAGVFPFLKVPVHLLNNSVVQADIYFGDGIVNLRNDIIRKQDAAEKFGVVEQWLLNLFDEKKAPPQEIMDIVAKLQSRPFARHDELLKDYPKTAKTLIGQFKKYCGLTPKVLHRIFRFNTLLANIHQKEEIIWTDVVYETGYADQSHFIKEFQEFCGFNPSKYIRDGYNTSIPNFFPLDRKG